MTDVVMPQLGETVTEGTITKWFKQPGETVAKDEVLFEVSTDKVDSEVPSPSGGVLAEILVAEGDTVDVGTVLAVIGEAGAAPAATPPEPTAPVAAPPPAPAPEPVPEPAAPGPPAPAPQPAPAPEPAPTADAAPAASDGGGRLLSPVVRRLLADHSLDPASITGTGLGGRITRSDVEKVIQSGAAAPAAPPTPSPPAPAPTPSTASPPAPAPTPSTASPPAPAPTPSTASPPVPAPTPSPAAPVSAPVAAATTEVAAGSDTIVSHGDHGVPLSNIRRRTAEHMVMSKATSPHVLTAVEVDFENVERVRQAHRAEWKAEEGFSLTYLPFIARALADALHDFPHMNASVGDGELVVHGDLHLAIAVDLDYEGLLAPVVRHADAKRLRAISREIVDLAERARAKKLSADEIVGGTFTVTNPGQYGTMMQFPIINQPQVAILSTDGIRRKPVVVTDADGNEAIAVHSVGVLALAWDHRAFDGAYAAAFLARLREIIETRDWEAEI